MIASSELVINADGSVFHLHVKPEQLADRVILVGDPARVSLVASFFDTKNAKCRAGSFIRLRERIGEREFRLFLMASEPITSILF